MSPQTKKLLKAILLFLLTLLVFSGLAAYLLYVMLEADPLRNREVFAENAQLADEIGIGIAALVECFGILCAWAVSQLYLDTHAE